MTQHFLEDVALRAGSRVGRTARGGPKESAHPLETLQRSIGNEAVAGLVQRQTDEETDSAGEQAGNSGESVGRDAAFWEGLSHRPDSAADVAGQSIRAGEVAGEQAAGSGAQAGSEAKVLSEFELYF